MEGGKGRTGNDGVHGLVRLAGEGSLEGTGKAGGSVTSRLIAEGEVGSDCKSTSVTGVIREKRVMMRVKMYHILTGMLKRLHGQNMKETQMTWICCICKGGASLLKLLF